MSIISESDLNSATAFSSNEDQFCIEDLEENQIIEKIRRMCSSIKNISIENRLFLSVLENSSSDQNSSKKQLILSNELSQKQSNENLSNIHQNNNSISAQQNNNFELFNNNNEIASNSSVI